MPTMMPFGLLLLMHGGKLFLIRKLLNQYALLNMPSALINQKSYKGLNPKDSVNRFTWLEVGSLENDLWISAQAISRNLTLVTNDNKSGMKRIRDIAGDSLNIENWAEDRK